MIRTITPDLATVKQGKGVEDYFKLYFFFFFYTLIKFPFNFFFISGEVASEQTSPMYHLLDHGYGQTPQNQIIRIPSRTEASVSLILNLERSL